VIFAKGIVSVEFLVDMVKHSLWKWYPAKNLVTPAPFMSGRCNKYCVGVDSGKWAVCCGSHCLMVLIDVFFVGLLFFLFSPLLSDVLAQVFVAMCFCSFGEMYF
jgi:hypothetical protein